jgi:pimeloyl-ACP methyl ester carboxylesterase
MASFEFGFNPEYAEELVEYWKTKYNWKDQVTKLNRYPQFRITFNDTTIHYVRFQTNAKSGLKPTPVLIMDGWPGSYFGFYKMLDYMNENFKDVSFDIVVPTIPGFGYSTPLNRVFEGVDTALHFDALMRYIHGEDCQYFAHGEG